MEDISVKFQETLNEMKEIYTQNGIPWVIGFSGGKDSSTVVQLVYTMLLELREKNTPLKDVHVIASDTLVENPIIETFLDSTLQRVGEGAHKDGLPLFAHKVVPEMHNTFWVSLLGKGYPSPNRFFRWCTERLKIKPSTKFIQQQIDEFGSVVILLGARKEESSTRAQVLENYRIKDSILRRHATMPQALIYTPIADWSTDDVWMFLMTTPPPWDETSRHNIVLRDLYRDAAGGECPLVIDVSTPSCGQNRFGCWTCTVVATDSSMEGFLEVGGSYEALTPLLKFRNKLKVYRDDAEKRESWRRNDPDRPRGWVVEFGQITDESVDSDNPQDESTSQLGPFKLHVRQELLQELLQIQKETGYKLIQDQELDLIRRYWTEDYRVGPMAMIEILEEVFGRATNQEGYKRQFQLLEEVCQDRNVDILAIDRLLDLERGYITKLRKRGLIEAMDTIITDLTSKEKVADNANTQS